MEILESGKKTKKAIKKNKNNQKESIKPLGNH
jgi:hypothetical protein